jgi:hypothetical protein
MKYSVVVVTVVVAHELQQRLRSSLQHIGRKSLHLVTAEVKRCEIGKVHERHRQRLYGIILQSESLRKEQRDGQHKVTDGLKHSAGALSNIR